MRRPLVSVVLLYAMGLWLGDRLPLPLPGLFALALVALLIALRPGRTGAIAIAPALVLCGWINLVQHTASISPHDLRERFGPIPELVTLRGRLDKEPALRDPDAREERARSLAVLRVDAFLHNGSWEPVLGRVVVATRGHPGPEFIVGRAVEVHGVLRVPRTATAEGGFDYRSHLARRGIYFELDVWSTADWLLIDEEGGRRRPLAARFRAWARETLGTGLPEDDESLRLIWAMVLGWRTALTDDVAEPFRRSGTMHVFAISGLHIGMIAGILVSVSRVARIPRGGCLFVVIPLLWFYTAATGWQSSAVRATVMMSVVVAGWSLRRPGDLLNSLAAAALLILLWDPQQLFQAGFQLSFSVVFAIGVLLPPLGRLRDRLLRHDPLLPDDLRAPWQRRLDRPFRHLLDGMSISLAAWLGSIPWMAWHFQIFTPVTLAANLLIVPLAAGVLASGLASLACGGLWPDLSVLFNHSAWFWMTLMARTSERAATLPGAWFHVPAPPWYVLAVYYPLLAALATGWLLQRRRLLAAAPLLLATIAVAAVVHHRHRENHSLTILALRGGDGLYFDAPGRAFDMLIDTGDAIAFQTDVGPFLRSRGVNRLPWLLLTHGDVRHVGGAGLLLDQLAVDQIVTSDIRFRSGPYRDIVRRLESIPERWNRVHRGDRLGPWEILHPAAHDRFSRADDSALVLRGTFHGTRVLLCSDLGRIGQRILAERESNLQADIVVAGMPNQDEPLGNLFLDAVQPAVIVVSAGESPANERPSPELRERLGARGIPVLFTCDTGAVTIVFRSNGWELRTMDGRRYTGPGFNSRADTAPRHRHTAPHDPVHRNHAGDPAGHGLPSVDPRHGQPRRTRHNRGSGAVR
jgi:competence protein ComEC